MSHLRAGLSAALLILTVAACGGGGGSSTQPAPAPSHAPSVAPMPSPSPSAVAGQANHIGAGFSGPGQSAASAVRKIKSTTVSSSIETVIQSYTANANWGNLYGSLYVWAFSSTSGASVPETSLAVAITGTGLTIQNYAADPNAFEGIANDWSIAFNSATARGTYDVTATFGDGTTGQIPVDVYDTFYVGCPDTTPTPPIGNSYATGAPQPSATGSSDVYIDCTGFNLVFPNGGVVAQGPTADEYGNVVTTIAGVTTVPAVPATSLSIPLTSLTIGEVVVARTSTGGYAKFEPASVYSGGGVYGVTGYALAASSGSNFAY